MNWSDTKAEMKKEGPRTHSWVNVYDTGQWHSLWDLTPTILDDPSVSITVASVAHTVRQVSQIDSSTTVGLRLYGVPKSGPQTRSRYVSMGQPNPNDTSGDYSLQLDDSGDLKGSAASQIAKLHRVTKVTFMNVDHQWDTQLFWAIATAMPNRFAEIRANGKVECVTMNRIEREPLYQDWVKEQEAKRNAPIQEAALQNGKLRSHLDASSGKKVEAHRVTTKTYTLGPGESLSSIAAKVYGTSGKWKQLYDANIGVIGSNPSALRSGMTLAI